MANQDIRLAAKGSGVALWRIAEKLGISEPTMTRRLRTELNADEKAHIMNIIAELKGA